MTDLVDELVRISGAISRGDMSSYQSNECYTVGAFDLLLVKAHGADAFQLVEALCGRYPSVKASGDSPTGYFGLLTQLARQSGTTEVPQGLGAIIAQHPELSTDLRAWYRLEG